MDAHNFVVMDPNDNQVDGISDLSIHISDVIAVIESTDPSAQGMFPNDLNSIAPVANHSPINGISANMPPQQSHQSNDAPYATILEQPASKALRFRYECEGRSAGSIPGANSTSDNKTYPTIQIANYVGRAVVVVSCVTKDFPYKPHPHNLVGKEGCKKGVCTLEINTDDMKMVFSNLGIQCVKRRDIEEALKVREEIRVDPFRTGYAHRNQPSSIDLNAVRLCFQVFLEGQQKGKFTVPLKPIVSDPIYDKKSMSDLVITKLSHCNAFCNGGQEMILLCEKVAKEDIQVRFYEEIMNPEEAWEANGEFQHSQVHKQVAISFRTPRYKRIDITDPVKVKIQLRRPSDGATSDPLDFEMLPLNEGRRSFWNLQRELKKRSATTDLFQQLLEVDNEEKVNVVNFNSVNSLPLQSNNSNSNDNITEVVVLDTPMEEESKPIVDEKTMHWLENAEFIIDGNNNNENNQNIINQNDDDKTLSDLLEQVAELDVIYQDHQIRKENMILQNELNEMDQVLPMDEGTEHMETEFDDAATYSSLQKAFKHPVVFADAPPLPPKPGQTSDGLFDLILPPIVINPATPDIFLRREDERLPPLPPKRAKKVSESNVDKENIVENQSIVEFDNQSLIGLVRNNSIKSLTPRPQQQIVIKSADLRRSPSHKLPPKPPSSVTSSPTNTLPKQKKQGFFSKIFSRRKSRSDLDSSITDSIVKVETDMPPEYDETLEIHFDSDDANRAQFIADSSPMRSTKSLKSPKKQKIGKPVERSVSSVSGKRPHLTPDIIHIPLKGDSSTNSLPLHQSGSGTHLSLPGNDFYERASTASLHPIDRKTMSALQLADVPIQDGDMELVAIADAQSLRNLCESGEHGIILDPSVDLTEAEHYALYTTLAPHATESEFDENSCYYQPVEAGQILTPADVARRLVNDSY